MAGVIAAEETGSSNRSSAIGLVGAAYAVGTGLVAIARGVADDLLGFRGVFFLAALPLLALPWLGRLVREPDRYHRSRATVDPSRRPAFGMVPTSVRSTVAGWLAAMQVLGAVTGLASFGILADVLAGFGPAAAAVTLPVVALSLLYMRLPETRGLELEESAPEQS